METLVNVKSIVKGVSECDPIMLLESPDKTRRLVFIPYIHNKPDKDGSVNGSFVYQRKLKADEWEKINVEGESLSRLKSGEGYRLDLNSHAVNELIQGLMAINEIAEQVKKGKTNTTYIPSKTDLAPILQQLIESSSDGEIVEELIKLGVENAVKINDLISNVRIRQAISYWQANKNDNVEENWQKFFSARPWIFTLIFAEPIVVLQSKMYVGGTNISGKGGKMVDYGLINKNTNNTAILEIKTPKTPLLAGEYRRIFPPSTELSGSVTQVQNYKYNMLKNLPSLKEEYGAFDAVNIPTYVIAGNSKQLENDIQRRSFELYRKNTRDTVVLAYDEVFRRLELLIG